MNIDKYNIETKICCMLRQWSYCLSTVGNLRERNSTEDYNLLENFIQRGTPNSIVSIVANCRDYSLKREYNSIALLLRVNNAVAKISRHLSLSQNKRDKISFEFMNNKSELKSNTIIYSTNDINTENIILTKDKTPDDANLALKYNNDFEEDFQEQDKGQRCRYRGVTLHLFNEKLKREDGTLIRNIDISVENRKTSRLVRRIVEKRMSKACFKQHRNLRQENSNKYRHYLKRAVSFQLFNIGQVENTENISRKESSHWKRMYDPTTGKYVFKKKVGYNTLEEAMDSIEHWKKNHPEDKETMSAYICAFCHKIHIGHTPYFYITKNGN